MPLSSADEPRPAVPPKSLKWMTPGQVAAVLAEDPRLILPVGTCERFGDALPFGTATIIVERLADDLSAEFGVLRAPTVEYGVNADPPAGYPGRVCLRKKTLHRFLNDMLAAWEQHGVTEFILLTAHGHDLHQEAMDTVFTVSARVRVVDLFAVNLSDLIGHRRKEDDRSALYLPMLAHLAPDALGQTPEDPEELAAQGRTLYDRIRARVSERIFLAPVPTE